MQTNLLKLFLLSLLSVVIALSPVRSFAEDKPAAPPGQEKPKPRLIVFRGSVSAIDKKAMTITIGQRTFQVTSATKIYKEGKPGKLEDGAAGDEAGGSYLKGEDGSANLQTLRFGAKPEANPAK